MLRAFLLLALLGLPAWAQAPLRIALLAFRPKAQMISQWQPLAQYLEANLGQPVTITPYDYPELGAATARGEVDVVLTNPGHYIMLRQRSVMSAPLVTQVSRQGPHRLSAFGGVIFVRAEDNRIQSLQDLAGKRVASTGIESMGGYQMQAFEMAEAALRPASGKLLPTLAMPHDLAIDAVLSGQADAGFARTGILEAMVAEGRLDLRRLRVINRQELASFPFLVSTRLHPEWPVAVLPQVDVALADRLAIALLQIQPDSEVARSAGIFGFTVPSDYGGVEQMLRKLRLPPFERAPEITLADLWGRYAPWITALGVALLGLLAMSARLGYQKRRVQQGEARSSTILDNVDAYIYLKDPAGRYIYANQRVLRLWELPREQVLGRGDEAFFDPESVLRIRRADRQVLFEGRTLHLEETNTIPRTGRTASYWSTKLPLRRPDGRIYALCGISTDISERKQAEATRAHLAAIVESSEDAIISKSLEGIIASWNAAAVRMFGYSAEEAIGRSILMLLPPDRQAEEAEILDRIRAGESVEHLETVRLTKDGRGLEVSVTLSPIRDADGQVAGASKIIRDISDRKAAERALKDALAFSEQIISSAQEGIVVYDPEGRLVRINTFLEELSGLSSAEIAGMRPLEAFPFLEAAGVEFGMLANLRGERFALPPFAWHFPRTGRSGWATSVQGPLRGAKGEIIGAIGVVSDISEVRKAEALQRQLEADLQQTRKLESLGSLAGGVAHDMNNVLAAIQAIAQTLSLGHPEDPALLEALGTIDKASTRGRDLVRGLTNFARKGLREAHVLDLNSLVQEEVDILRRTTLQKVDLVLELDPSAPQVHGERSSLASALMNLCVNAVDAMPEGGTLTLRTRRLAEDQVELAVEDSGQGMSAEVRARALEPFFTTKPMGQGTGLGLAMVYSTVTTHGGSVAIASEPGHGTQITLRLPTVAAADGDGPQAPAAAETSAGLRILQVDDDELILASVPRMIEAFGHRVATANGGREALALLAADPAFDLVILDLNMPGMNGAETLRELRLALPELPVLLATGFLDGETEELLARDPLAWTIAKPFSMADLDLKFQEIAGRRH